MPWSDFSEFSYGHGAVRDAEALLLSAGQSLTSAPELPSLLKENTVGYDAKLTTLDLALFLQFKRSFYVSRLHTRGGPCGYSNGVPHCSWAYWQHKHYRVSIEVGSEQLRIMRDYESQIANGTLHGLAIYAAPVFHHARAWNQHYAAGQILDHSVGVEPSTFDNLPNGPHHYTCLGDMSAAQVFSEPRSATSGTARTAITNYINRRSAAADQAASQMTLSDLAAWARRAAGSLEAGLIGDTSSGQDAIRLLQDIAVLLGGAFVLVGHTTSQG